MGSGQLQGDTDGLAGSRTGSGGDVDAFEGKTFKGRIMAISSATGSKYSMIPTDNSAGNFVKIQQRVPVRIELTDISPEDNARLAAGMMCIVKARP